ncbi:MAG: 2-polyprenyl-3-methyl-6-methoxy-1,4-benzoquinone monooxygenase [Proteobacteria bacterium]|nr:2-polyprenyl-3-methyl-6-methoxy-1,4-benzoquinone monooxygenase [Pseudomonadota bacterium]MDA0929292.1 2-polyprenyl-3-methyl-6-methoxy-1,4-benzoquinone monooxygenase [Pseudomonadota bacterium]
MSRSPLTFIDQCLLQFDQALRTCVPGASHAERETPARKVVEQDMSKEEKRHAAGLMRINHTGEVCAQALYAGQASTARLDQVREAMEHAAAEEVDHLAWCEQRLNELDSRPSILNPLWYGLSFGMGALAGLAGDKWSLGFVAETERQVCDHLQEHMNRLPEQDEKSKAVLAQMIIDERQHGETATAAGGAPLPAPFKQAMTTMSQVMKKSTYHI